MKNLSPAPSAAVEIVRVADLMTYFKTPANATTPINIQLRPGTNIIGVNSTALGVTLNLTGPPGAVASYRWNRESGMAGVTVNRVTT